MINFDEIYKIMQESFPKSEIRNYEEQKALLNRSDYTMETLSIQGELKGFLAAFDLSPYCFVEHLATAKNYRNQGLGKEMMEKLMKQQSNTIVLEVEKPESEISIRRIGFYKRLGFHLNENFQYRQPKLQEDCDEVWLQIMSYDKELTLSELEELKSLLYKKVYAMEEE